MGDKAQLRLIDHRPVEDDDDIGTGDEYEEDPRTYAPRAPTGDILPEGAWVALAAFARLAAAAGMALYLAIHG